MKPEFLKNLKVGDQGLPQEVIDAIMAEHQRIVAANTTEITSLKDQLKTAKDGLKAFDGVDVAQLQGQITQLKKDLEDKDTAHQTELANMAFDRALETAITGAKGRSVKAILGELGTDKIAALRASKNQEADIKTALEALQKDRGFLFDTGTVPPQLARNTGVTPPASGDNPFSFNFGGIRAKDSK
jgi:uncharacterized protein (UPF0264 family)